MTGPDRSMNRGWFSRNARSIAGSTASLVVWFALLSITFPLFDGMIAETEVPPPLDTLVWGAYLVLFTLGYVLILRKVRRWIIPQWLG